MKDKIGRRKIVKIGMASIGGLIVLLFILLVILFNQEIQTMMSIKKISVKPAYEVTYHGDYQLDRYLSAGAKDWNGLFNFVNENLCHGVGKMIYGTYGCSSFSAKTPEGDYILARNLDTEIAVPSVIRTDPKGKNKTIGVANLHVAGWKENSALSKTTVLTSPYFTFDGMNAYGVAIASLTVPTGSRVDADENKVTIHDLTVDRVVMDKAESVEDAIQLLSGFNIKMEAKYPTHYMIADATGNSVIIEYINGSMKVLERNEDYQVATNFILYQNQKLQGYSSERYRAFDHALAQRQGIISVEDALNLLEQNIVPGEGQWSVVYNLTKKTMTVAFYGDYENIHEYGLDQ